MTNRVLLLVSLCMVGFLLSTPAHEDAEHEEGVALQPLLEEVAPPAEECFPRTVWVKALGGATWGVPLRLMAGLDCHDVGIHGPDQPTWAFQGDHPGALLVVDGRFPRVAEILGPPGEYVVEARFELEDGTVLAGRIKVEVVEYVAGEHTKAT